MLKKVLLAILILTVIGAGGVAIAYQMTRAATDRAADSTVIEQSEAVIVSASAPQTAPGGQPVAAAEGLIGDPWQASGVISSLDDNGLELASENGETVYVELVHPITGNPRAFPCRLGNGSP